MILLYLVGIFAFLVWWVRGSVWPGVLLFALSLAVIIKEHSSYMFDANAPHRAYLAIQTLCPPGSIQPCDYARSVSGGLMEAMAIGGRNAATDDSLPVFALLTVSCALIAFIPHLIARYRAEKADRLLNGVRFNYRD